MYVYVCMLACMWASCTTRPGVASTESESEPWAQAQTTIPKSASIAEPPTWLEKDASISVAQVITLHHHFKKKKWGFKQ